MNNQNWSKYGITKPYYADDAVCIIHSNCKDILLSIPNEAIDLLVTDPPYGIGFMGKDWDKFNDIVNPQGAYEHKKGFKKLPRQSSQYMTEFFTPIWRECLRILKPGAFVFVMCIPRADCLSRMIISLEDAGFMVNFTPIFWAYASGFPKAQNISKMADKRGAHSPDDLRKFKRWFREQIDKSPKTQEQINNECGFTATSYYKTDSKDYWTSAFPIPTKWLVIKRVMDLSDDWDWLIKRYDEERGWLENPTGGLAQNRLTPFSGRQLQSEPYTPQAKALDGSYGGFQPKPAVEVIIVAMKPLSEKTYVDQALKNQKGITWLDDGRIPIQKGDKENWGASKFNHGVSFSLATPDKRGTATPPNPLGRFPANLLVSDDVLNDGKNWRGECYQKTYISKGSIFTGANPLYNLGLRNDPSGSFSRYFDLDKWFESLLDKLKSKAYNRDKNIGSALWEVNQAEDKSGLKNKPMPAIGVVGSLPIMPVTAPNSIIFAQNPVMLNSDLADQNLDVKSAEGKLGYTETDIAQRLAQIKQDTETLLQMLESELIIPITQSEPSLFSQNVVSYVVSKLKDLRDIIQTSINAPRLFGSVVPAIIEQMRQDLSQDQLWQNFWQERVKLLPESQQRTFPFAVISKASKSEKNKNLNSPKKETPFLPSGAFETDNGEKKHTLMRNYHPTVKPLKLMSYLITLGSREGDIVLDPFLGSGTTALACKMLGRKSIGIEINKDYTEIAVKRCSQAVMRLEV